MGQIITTPPQVAVVESTCVGNTMGQIISTAATMAQIALCNTSKAMNVSSTSTGNSTKTADIVTALTARLSPPILLGHRLMLLRTNNKQQLL